RKETPIVLVDMHCEATSESIAMGWYLDGRVSAVVGTHRHVQTADERVLPGGTAHITDLALPGPAAANPPPPRPGLILDGKVGAQKGLDEVRAGVAHLRDTTRVVPTLAVVLV